MRGVEGKVDIIFLILNKGDKIYILGVLEMWGGKDNMISFLVI